MHKEKIFGFFSSIEDLHSFLGSCTLFKDLAKEIVQDLAQGIIFKRASKGSLIFNSHIPAEGIYLILEGRLGVSKNQETEPFYELSYKEAISDFAFLTKINFQIAVKALRDSDLLFFPKTSLLPLLQKNPIFLQALSSSLSALLHRIIKKIPAKKPFHTIALLAQNEELPLALFAQSLQEKMNLYAKTFHTSLSKAKKELASIDAAAFHSWIREKEENNSFVLLECSYLNQEWTKLCLKRADHILLVADSKDSPNISDCERPIWEEEASFVKIDLILLQHNSIIGTKKWLAARKARSHQHVFLKEEESIARLARILTQNSIGLVLSGGGARGLAQIGFLLAIMEEKIPIDFIGGTSIGSVNAALYALGWSYEKLSRNSSTIFSKEKGLLDPTAPFLSFLKGKKIYDNLLKYCGEVEIEDLKTTYFCISSNLTLKTPHMHTHGLLSEALRASISIPGIFPPVFNNHSLLVDGGLFDVLPIDYMRNYFDAAKIMAVDTSIDLFSPNYPELPPSVSGWKLFFQNLFSSQGKRLNLVEILSSAAEISGQRKKRWVIENHIADFYVRLPVGRYGTLAFRSSKELKEKGYRFTKEILKEWKNLF